MFHSETLTAGMLFCKGTKFKKLLLGIPAT